MQVLCIDLGNSNNTLNKLNRYKKLCSRFFLLSRQKKIVYFGGEMWSSR